MTIPDLITQILSQLRNGFYSERPAREFRRDEPFLVAAIGTYGYECHQRGWEFDAQFIYRQLCDLLLSFKRRTTPADIEYMPLYLQRAIKQHIREHAEELKTQSREISRVSNKVVGGVRIAQVVIEPTATEVLGKVYKDVNKLRRQSAAAARLKSAEQKRQGELL